MSTGRHNKLWALQLAGEKRNRRTVHNSLQMSEIPDIVSGISDMDYNKSFAHTLINIALDFWLPSLAIICIKSLFLDL